MCWASHGARMPGDMVLEAMSVLAFGAYVIVRPGSQLTHEQMTMINS